MHTYTRVLKGVMMEGIETGVVMLFETHGLVIDEVCEVLIAVVSVGSVALLNASFTCLEPAPAWVL
jgi:hypothetical protein